MHSNHTNLVMTGREDNLRIDHAFVCGFRDAGLQHSVAMRFAPFTCAQTQDNVRLGWNEPTRDMIGDSAKERAYLFCGRPHWRTKCRKQSSLLLSSPLSASLLALRKSRLRLRLRLRSRPSPTTPASTSNSVRGRRYAAAPGKFARLGGLRASGAAKQPLILSISLFLPMRLALMGAGMLFPSVTTEVQTC